MVTHESQSLFWERNIGQSEAFWRFVTPRLKQNLGYGTALGKSTAEDFHHAINGVSPGLIRVMADEIHYPLHIIGKFLAAKGGNICLI